MPANYHSLAAGASLSKIEDRAAFRKPDSQVTCSEACWNGVGMFSYGVNCSVTFSVTI